MRLWAALRAPAACALPPLPSFPSASELSLLQLHRMEKAECLARREEAWAARVQPLLLSNWDVGFPTEPTRIGGVAAVLLASTNLLTFLYVADRDPPCTGLQFGPPSLGIPRRRIFLKRNRS